MFELYEIAKNTVNFCSSLPTSPFIRSVVAQPRRRRLDLPIPLGVLDPILFVPILPIRIPSGHPFGRMPRFQALFAVHRVDGFE